MEKDGGQELQLKEKNFPNGSLILKNFHKTYAG